MIPGSANPLLLASAAGSPAPSYQIERSLRFNSSDSAYLSRTPSVAGNRKTWTWAGWVKRTNLSTNSRIWSGGSTTSDTGYFSVDFFNSAIAIAGYSTNYRITTAVYRDPSAWMHIVVAVDTNQSTPDNRIRLYVNSSEVTTFSTNNTFTQGNDTGVNQAQLHLIGGNPFNSADKPDMYLADVHLIDGQQLTPSSFTEVDATTGQLVPKAYLGTYGTNGFHLDFSDNSTAAALGTDTSGAGNNWTVNNISVAAGAGNDSLVDTPTSYGTDDGLGGSVRGNYATLNPLHTVSTGGTFSNGNLDFTANNKSAVSTVAVSSGKWYFEGVMTATSGPGDGSGFGIYNTAGQVGYIRNETTPNFTSTIPGVSSISPFGSNFTTGDLIGVAFDADAGTLQFTKNGSGYGALITGIPSGVWYLLSVSRSSYTLSALTVNFGQRPFAYPAPSGFKALCTTNLPEPLIADGSTVMDVVLDTGANILTAAQGAIGGSADLLWIKDRANANNHQLIDTVRGGTATLQSNTTAAETTYSAPSGSSVAWCWDAGSSTVTNTRGSITSSVRANPSAGFSIVTYTGTGSNASVGHGLGVAPAFIIAKKRNGTSDWLTNGPGLAAPWGGALQVNTTSAFIASSGIWLSLSPTSQVFFIGTADAVNYPAATHVAYCFAPVAGYSAFGSYTGNGSADGPFVYTGFRPRWILTKLSSAAGADWLIFDTIRSESNVIQANLRPNTSGAEESSLARIDALSNGFKVRAVGATEPNQSGQTYIYAAFAEHPFQTARAR